MASQSTNQGNGLNFAEKCMLNLSTCDPMKFKFSSNNAFWKSKKAGNSGIVKFEVYQNQENRERMNV